ncbi:MAG: stage II sporulation protein M [Myxococcales bacterium]|nr:stage II sporulation protein M [Myxococcales bacterium]
MSQGGAQSPRSVAFRREREAEWTRLEEMVEIALRGGLRKLDAWQLEELPRLYRQVLSSLSVARRTAMDRALVAYLEALAARAYLAVYGTRKTRRGALLEAFLHTFPRRFRALGGEMLLSAGIVALGALVAYALISLDPGWYDTFIAPELSQGRDPGAPTEALRAALYDGGMEGGETLFASFLFAHNAKIGMLCFALGFAAGVPTAYLLFSNGLMLGAFVQLYASRGLLFELMGWMLPHGIPEIGAVIFCGAAGLHLGRAMILPGQRSVADAIGEAGRRASIVVMGCVFLFAVAGVIEGIFRQSVTDDSIRYALALFNFTWLLAWIALGGRDGSEARLRFGGTRIKARSASGSEAA